MLYQLSYCPRWGEARLPAGLVGPSSGSRPPEIPGDGAPSPALRQRVSLWTVCLRSWLQYFFISSRSRSLIFDFIVM